MKKYVLRLSASGVLCLSVIGCGHEEDNSSGLAAAKVPVRVDTKNMTLNSTTDQLPVNALKSDELSNFSQKSPSCDISTEVEDFLNDLESQGRLANCAVMRAQLDRTQKDILPGGGI